MRFVLVTALNFIITHDVAKPNYMTRSAVQDGPISLYDTFRPAGPVKEIMPPEHMPCFEIFMISPSAAQSGGMS